MIIKYFNRADIYTYQVKTKICISSLNLNMNTRVASSNISITKKITKKILAELFPRLNRNETTQTNKN